MDKKFGETCWDDWRLWEGDNVHEITKFGGGSTDMVNHPAHYTRGKQEVIDTIEEAVSDAPSNKLALLQGQVLKYMLRLWLKENSKEDAEKARWYLNRLIDSL